MGNPVGDLLHSHVNDGRFLGYRFLDQSRRIVCLVIDLPNGVSSAKDPYQDGQLVTSAGTNRSVNPERQAIFRDVGNILKDVESGNWILLLRTSGAWNGRIDHRVVRVREGFGM